MASHALIFVHSTPPGWHALAAPDSEGPPVPGRRDPVSSFPHRAAADCLAPERERVCALGLPASVIDIMTPSTRAAYHYRWGLFTAWFTVHRLEPHFVTVDAILQFLESQLEAGRTAITLRGLVAAINAVRLGRSALSDADAALISQFLRGARCLTAHAPGSPVPPWDLDLVLGALERPPFKPLQQAGLKWLSLKTAFLLAITSARRISELQALSGSGGGAASPGPVPPFGRWRYTLLVLGRYVPRTNCSSRSIPDCAAGPCPSSGCPTGS